jgi:hypothetical protein
MRFIKTAASRFVTAVPFIGAGFGLAGVLLKTGDCFSYSFFLEKLM